MSLDAFIAATHRRIDDGHYALDGPLLPPNGSLLAAVVADPAAVIAELKPRSPSGGRLLDRSVQDVLGCYVRGGAGALSILADPDFFDGSPGLVREAHGTGLPLLWKDFVIDPAQVAAAAHHGASAVLVIERCFDTAADREAIVHAAQAAGLEVLLEIHGEAEWQRSRDSAADIWGVNARDLDTLAVDMEAARATVAAIAEVGRPVLALSGVKDRTDRLRAVAAGASGVLVGTSLMTHPFPDLALRAMRRPLAKVCGITDADGLRAAVDAGPDMVGFVVGAPRSPRNITPLAAQALRDAAGAAGVRTVLVTPHEDAWEVREWCRIVRPDMVQLHKLRPDADWIHSLGAIPTEILWAVAPDGTAPEDGMGIVVDTPSEHGTGGSGQTHRWTPVKDPRLSLVAGGLDAGNAPDAIRATGAWGSDASSQLEADGQPGRKDPKKVAAFVASVHGVQDA